MNLQHLHAFTIVAQQQSIRSAARVLGLSQPAVTRIMRELERNVQTPLLHRGSKGIELTAFGHALLRRAHLILEEARKAQDELDQMRDGAGGSLNIAISSTAALSMFPQALQRFRERMPRVALTISESAPPHTQDLLEAGRLDFAVLTELGDGAADGFERTVLLPMQLVVAGRKGHPLRGAKSIAQLRESLWLVPGIGDSATDYLSRVFRDHRLSAPQDVISCRSIVTALSIMENSDALGIFSRVVFDRRQRIANLSLLHLTEPLPVACLSLVTRPQSQPTPAARCLMTCLAEAAASLRETAP
ncbi:HTH-type transcriptional regulator TsaR [Pandoraea pnomenusa]|uniref:HTH-type transcriptional regulator TsaR n=1 Tax=Pandoraea pnomenusa TaxID=93220 RepID=A0ABY6WN02_9BURK|nr:LysR substrate-binding domain-containing protein [Pandoraea pnomenusa]VVE70278.1 HTH-type transcriptional regulator TsaR [Pandoraea pnomenusa]